MGDNVKEVESNSITAYRDIPYSVLDDDMTIQLRNDFFKELSEIKKYYEVYDKGAEFTTEGTQGDYIPMNVKFKRARKIINQEARFMFSQPLDIIINKNDNNDETVKAQNTIVNDFIQNVLTKNHFNSKLVKAAKDCFIGKRICVVLNFDSETGIKINFLNSLEFYYEMVDDELTKLVAFFVQTDSINLSDKIILKKTYEMIDGYCFITETLYDGTGRILEDTVEIPTKLEMIPAWVVINDGLVNDVKGESDIAQLIDGESAYSKLSNADMDSERKTMNTIKYTIDASSESTSNLSTSPGAYWDIQSDENGVEQKKASVGQLEPSMGYTEALKTTLERIDNNMHSAMSVPNIDSEKLQGMITSGKTIRALYYPLQVRSDEKMLVWYDMVIQLVDTIYKGALLYPDSAKDYTVEQLPSIQLDIFVETNYALPQDEEEEKAVDLQEVNAQVMSRKSYMKKWRGLTDEEADNELKQIALEREILEDTFSGMESSNDDSGFEDEPELDIE